MPKQAFFMHHPLHPTKARNSNKVVPGRVPFDIRASIVSGRSAQFGSCVVMADGYAPNTVGGNQDPCIFADPFPMLHAFCRIDGRRHAVEGTNPRQVLSHAVGAGDIIFYGSLSCSRGAPRHLHVDTVMVVQQTISWPCLRLGTRVARKLLCNASLAQALLGPTASFATLKKTMAWRYLLSDAGVGRDHETTFLRDHRVIVGAASPTPSALRARATSYVPLGEPHVTSATRAAMSARWRPVMLNPTSAKSVWPGLTALVKKHKGLAGSGQKPSVRISSALADDLYDAVVALSGVGQGFSGAVAVPPVSPAGRLNHTVANC